MSNAGTLLQIVPRAPSDCGGVGDYSEQLARSLQELHGITSTFVSAAPVTSSRTADGFAVLSPLRTLSDVLDSPTALLLHYVNYGYNPRGVPVWLPSVLRRSQSVCDGRLVTVFHELYAVGSWRQSAFWLRPVQMHIAQTVAGLSAISIVSNEIQQAQLEKLAPRANVVLQPVASNFGEPALSFARLVERDPHRWIICGGTELVERSLTSFLQNASFIGAPFSPRELFVVGGVEREEIRARLGGQQDIRTHYYPNVEAKTGCGNSLHLRFCLDRLLSSAGCSDGDDSKIDRVRRVLLPWRYPRVSAPRLADSSASRYTARSVFCNRIRTESSIRAGARADR